MKQLGDEDDRAISVLPSSRDGVYIRCDQKDSGEESGELIASLADGDANRSTEEAADLIYHVAVALEAVGSSLDEVAQRLFDRAGSGREKLTSSR